MARGISQRFLDIAQREQRLGWRAALAAALLAPAAAFLADLADAPGYGPVWAFFWVAALLGLGLGFLWTRRRLAHYEDDLRLQWNHVMREAGGAERLRDVDRRLHRKDPLPQALGGAAAALILLLNVALFALLWTEHALAPGLAWLIVALDGVLLGALVSGSALVIRWARDFVASAEELVRRGEVGLWGER